MIMAMSIWQSLPSCGLANGVLVSPCYVQGCPWPGNAAQHCDSVATCHNDSNPQAVFEVIRATNGTYGNVFVGVQAEPDSARYFNFDNMSVQNTVCLAQRAFILFISCDLCACGVYTIDLALRSDTIPYEYTLHG